MGRGVLRHDQHRHLRARARGLRLHPRGRGRRLLRRRVPGGARARASTLLRPRRRRLLGGRRHARGVPAARTQDVLDGRVQRRHRRLPSSATGVWLGEGAEVDPDAAHRRPGRSSATTAAIEAGAHAARVHRARHRRRREGRRVPRARGRATTTCTSGRGADLRGCGRSGASRDLRAHARGRGGRRRRRRVLRRRGRGHQPGREGLPVQDRRGRRGRHLVDRVGEPGRAHAVRPARRARASPTSTSPPRSRCASRWRTAPSLKKGSVVTHEPRHEPRRPRAQAGDHRRPQPRRASTSRTSSSPPCRSPGSRCATSRSQGGITVRLAPERPRQRRDPVLRRRRPRHRRGDAAQDRAAALPRGLPPRVRRRHRRHRVPAPRRSSSTPPRSRRASTSSRLRERGVQGRARLLVRRGVDRDAERARQARRRGARGEPVREHRVGAPTRRGSRRARSRGSATSCARRAATSGS